MESTAKLQSLDSQSTQARAFEPDLIERVELFTEFPIQSNLLDKCRFLHIFRKDIDGKFTYANPLLLNKIGVQLDEFIGKTDDFFFPPELVQQYRLKDQSAIQTRGSVALTKEYFQLKGSTNRIAINTIKACLADLDGDTNGMQGIFWLENEDHEAKQELCEIIFKLEHQFKELVEGWPDIVFHHDEKLILHYTNPAAERELLFAPNEITGKDLWSLVDETQVHPNRKKSYLGFLSWCLRNRSARLRAIRLTLPLKKKNGQVTVLNVRLMHHSMIHGQNQFWGIARIVEIVPKEFSVEMMGYAKQTSCSVFGQDVVHQLKRYVVGINDRLTPLQDAITNGKISEGTTIIQAIQDCCEDFRRESDAFLSKVKGGRFGKTMGNLNNIVYSLQRIYSQPGRRISRTFPFDRFEDLPASEFDDFFLLEACIALMENALRATPATGMIKFATGISSCRQWVWVCVRNEGDGFPNSVLRAWKERQLNPRMPSSKKSGGMGLHFCQRIIEMHEGMLEFGNEPHSTAGKKWAYAKISLRKYEQSK